MSADRRSPPAIVEVLRLLAVVFFAGIGYEVARSLSDGERSVLGPLNGAALGVIVGSGLGYVLGGVLGRTTVTTVDRTALSLREVSVESLVAGVIGLVVGVLCGAAIGLPLFLIPEPFIFLPLYTLLIVVLGLLGFRVGQSQRDGMLELFGARAGLAPRPVAASLLPRLIDSSVAIDGRVLHVVQSGFLHGVMVVCAPVLAELQGLADAGDDLRRSRGRRGLETLAALRREPGVELAVWDDDVPEVAEVDAKLVRLCLDRQAALLTLDTNLAKAASLAGVQVLNLHSLTLALRPTVQAGDDVTVLLIKPGKEPGQAVGYLDDGTMVVAEQLRAKVGKETAVRVTSVLTTANGRMVFAVPADADEGQPVRRRASRT
ncbi:MAG TPA: PIN domain-containing protein [Mycobacteriales bacterium]|nr:PIN domain-containing protein [Mycobacteriales bacterium]